MLTAFVLMYYVTGYRGGGPDSIEFSTKEACESAIIELKKQNIGISIPYAFCVER